MNRILVATDLTARSDRALHRAVTLAEAFGTALEVLHVVDHHLPDGVARQHEAAARAEIAQLLAALPKALPLAVRTTIVRGTDFSDIAAQADAAEADLVVLGIHRHDTPLLFQGTTAERVVRCSRRPVLVVKDAVRGPYRRALVGVDLSPQALAAIELAASLVPRGDLHLVHVTHRPFRSLLGRETQEALVRAERTRVRAALDTRIAALVTAYGADAPRVHVEMADGDPLLGIRARVDALSPDVLAVGTHGRTGLSHAVIGSIAADLLASAPVDVLAVKTTSERAT